jgi:hypothetical protein
MGFPFSLLHDVRLLFLSHSPLLLSLFIPLFSTCSFHYPPLYHPFFLLLSSRFPLPQFILSLTAKYPLEYMLCATGPKSLVLINVFPFFFGLQSSMEVIPEEHQHPPTVASSCSDLVAQLIE